MKLKQTPEDFVVEEIGKFDLAPSGPYKLYLLEKQGIESFGLLRYLSSRNDIPSSSIGVAGLKDKHAITRQYITIPSEYDFRTVAEKNFSLKFVGFVRKPVEQGSHLGNRFEITARAVRKSEFAGLKKKAEDLLQGVPNYFDYQRFGSVINSGCFIIKKIIEQDYEGAVKLYLTTYTKSEKLSSKDDKRKILDAWPDLSKITVKGGHLAYIIDQYNLTGNWLSAYNKIKRELREMFVNAYQSYLWNECVKEMLKQKIPEKNRFTVDYPVGKLLFYKNAAREVLERIPAEFPTIAPKSQYKGIEKDVVGRVLGKEGLEPADFDIRKATKTYFKEYRRPVIVTPKNFKMGEPVPDELNGGPSCPMYKIRVSFELPKGSYATLITKRLFGK